MHQTHLFMKSWVQDVTSLTWIKELLFLCGVGDALKHAGVCFTLVGLRVDVSTQRRSRRPPPSRCLSRSTGPEGFYTDDRKAPSQSRPAWSLLPAGSGEKIHTKLHEITLHLELLWITFKGKKTQTENTVISALAEGHMELFKPLYLFFTFYTLKKIFRPNI